MELNKNNSTEIVINEVVKETEKAVLVSLPVSWNANVHTREFWFPKSCVELFTRTMSVASFLIEKMMQQNAFHGYRMTFEEIR